MRTQSGFNVGGPTLSRIRRRWTLRATALPYTDVDTVMALWETNFAGNIPFDWTREDTGDTVVARFLGGEMPRRQVHTLRGVGAEELRFSVEEMWGSESFN